MASPTNSVLNSNTTLKTNANGTTRVSGTASGINWQESVDLMVQARKVPTDRLSAKIDANKIKIEAYKEMRTLASDLQAAVANLRRTLSFDKASDAFETKQPIATTTRNSSTLYSPTTRSASAAGNLIGVAVKNNAEVGDHQIEVLRTARAHKVSSDLQSSSTTALAQTGSFIINGKTVTVSSTDTLQDLRDKINNSEAEVTASIVNVGTNQFYLVINADETGETITFTDTDNILSSVGVVDAGNFKNVLQTPQTALFTADNLKDSSKTRYQSDIAYSSTVALSTLAKVSGGPHTMRITHATAGNIDVTYSSTDSLEDVADAINTAGGGTITAEIETLEGGQGYRLVIKDTGSDEAITSISDVSGNLAASMNFDNPLLIERSSNTIGDFLPGVTLSLFQAEPGTRINLSIAPDANKAKETIVNFVTAYNEFTKFYNSQNFTVNEDGTPSDETGPLYGNSAMRELRQAITDSFSDAVRGVDTAFASLAQIGITIDIDLVSDPELKNVLSIDETTLDNALLNNFEDVKKLFGFSFTKSNPQLTLTSFDNDVERPAAPLDIAWVFTDGKLSSVTVNGVATAVDIDNGADEVGNTFTITSGPGAGLSFLVSGTTDGSSTLDYTVGFAVNITGEVEDFTDLLTGNIENEIKSLEEENVTAQEKVDRDLERLEDYRARITASFIAMEQAMEEANKLLETLKQSFASSNNG